MSEDTLEQQAIELRQQGESARSIAALLGSSSSTIDRIIADAETRGIVFPGVVKSRDGRQYTIRADRGALLTGPVATSERPATVDPNEGWVRAAANRSTPVAPPALVQAVKDALIAEGWGKPGLPVIKSTPAPPTPPPPESEKNRTIRLNNAKSKIAEQYKIGTFLQVQSYAEIDAWALREVRTPEVIAQETAAVAAAADAWAMYESAIHRAREASAHVRMAGTEEAEEAARRVAELARHDEVAAEISAQEKAAAVARIRAEIQAQVTAVITTHREACWKGTRPFAIAALAEHAEVDEQQADKILRQRVEEAIHVTIDDPRGVLWPRYKEILWRHLAWVEKTQLALAKDGAERHWRPGGNNDLR